MKTEEKFTPIPARVRCNWFKPYLAIDRCGWLQKDGNCGQEPGPEKCPTKGRETGEVEVQ